MGKIKQIKAIILSNIPNDHLFNLGIYFFILPIIEARAEIFQKYGPLFARFEDAKIPF